VIVEVARVLHKPCKNWQVFPEISKKAIELGTKIWNMVIEGIKIAVAAIASIIPAKIGSLPDLAKIGEDIWNGIV